MADLTMIVLSRNRAYFEELDDCLSNQTGTAGLDIWPVLVNNANDPRLTASALKRGWQVVEPGYNTSFAGGNNLAMRAAAKDSHVLLLNDDIQPRPSFLRELWRQRDTADILGALLLHTDGTVNHAGVFITVGNMNHIGRHERPDQFVGRYPLVPAVTFAAALIRRELWDKLDGLCEGYYYGWEDIDFCMRALEAGASIRCCGDAIAIHDECGTRPRIIGTTELANYDLHESRWRAKLPSLLTAYCQRMRPEKVEGV